MIDEPPDWHSLLAGISRGKTRLECGANHTIYVQGEVADSVFFLLRGRVRLAVASQDGKEGIVGTLSAGDFFGEKSLIDEPLRTVTASALGECTLIRVEKAKLAQALREDLKLADEFIRRLLFRIVRNEADLIDQLFNSSEKRLARLLLLLSHFGENSTSEEVVHGVNQEHLAQMVGTTRSRINYFMNRFRKLGFIDYTGGSGLTVHRGLRKIVQRD